MPHLPILILAAGSSSRMRGGDKLLEMVAGKPMLAHVAAQALASGAPVIVVLPPDRPARQAALSGLPVQQVLAPDASAGMTASLRHGITALPPDAPGVMILPADMPGLTADDLRLMLEAFAATPDRILRGATADGHEGHPAIFPADLIPALAQLTGDEGGRSVLKANRARLTCVILPGDHAVLDLDTPEDWAAWRADGRA